MTSAKRLFLLTVGCAALATGEDQPLKVWLVLNEPSSKPKAPIATDADPEQFFSGWRAKGIDLYANRSRADQDPDYALALKSQIFVLGTVADFRKRQNSFPVVEIRFFTWDEYFDKLKNAPAGALGPNLVQVPSTWCVSLATSFQILAPTKAELLNRFPAQVKQACQPEGDSQTYGIPWTVDVRLLFFWRRDFPTLAQDLEQPHNRRGTFERALSVAEKTMGRPPFTMPSARDWELLHQTSLLVWAYDGDLIDADRELALFPSHRAAFARPALNGALFLKSLLNRKLLDLPRINRDQAEQRFIEQQRGSILSGPWMLARLADQFGENLQSHIGIALPPFSDSAPTFIGGSFLSVTRGSPVNMNSQAEALATHLAIGDQAALFARKTGLVPADDKARGDSNVGAANTDDKTFYGHLRYLTSTDHFSQTIGKAIEKGRPYPRIPEWWLLEEPARIGALYRFWQDIADAQPDRELQADLDAVVSEWNASLRHFPWWTSFAIALAFLVLASTYWGFRIMRLRSRKIAAITADLADNRQALETASTRLERTTKDCEIARSESRERTAERDAMIHSLDREVLHLQDILKTRPAPPHLRPEPPAFPTVEQPLEVLLRGDEVELRFSGKSSKVLGFNGKVFSHLTRASLLDHAPVHFSGILGLLLFWKTESSLPRLGVRKRWEGIASEMRTALGEVGLSAAESQAIKISFGTEGSYEFSVDERRCKVLVASGGKEIPFVEYVRTPIVKGRERLVARDVRAARNYALTALRSEQDIWFSDLAVLLLVVQTFAQTPSTDVSGEDEKLYSHARKQLKRRLDDFSTVVTNYPRERLMRTLDFPNISDNGERDLLTQRDRIDEARLRAEQALGSPSEIPAHALEVPETISRDWEIWKEREKFRTVWSQEEWEVRTQDAFIGIISYFNGTTVNVVIEEAMAGLRLLDPDACNDKRDDLLKINSENVTFLLDQTQLPEAKAVTMVGHLGWMLKESLCNQLRAKLMDQGQHSILLDCASGKWPEQATRLQSGIKKEMESGQWPMPFDRVVERLIAIREPISATAAHP